MSTSNDTSLDTSRSARLATFFMILKLTLIGSVIWSLLFICFGFYIESSFPTVFAIILGSAYFMRETLITNKQLKILYTTLIFILPFSLQIIMGGIFKSGFVAVWAVLSPLSALLFLRYKDALRLFILFIVTLLLLIIYEIFALKSIEINAFFNTFLLAANIIAINIICFITLSFFTGQVVKSKKEINLKTEEKDKGIDYTKTVQKTIINSNLIKLKEHLKFFTFSIEKEEINGSFIWNNISTDKVIHIAIADCHGTDVPAALLSILGSTFLDEIIKSNKNLSPSDTLQKINTLLINKQQSQNNINELFKIDMTLLKIDLINHTTEFSTANSSLITYQEELNLIKSDTAPLGCNKETIYKTQKLEGRKNNKIYIYSNGISDSNQAVNQENLLHIIDKIKDSTITTQEIQISNEITNLTEDKETSNDLLIMGLRL